MKSERNVWIDIAKTVAIIGVVFQHLRGWAYDNTTVYNLILYAVALFVLTGGYNIMKSYLRTGHVSVLKRIFSMVIAYVIATLFYSLYEGEITNPVYIAHSITHFDACAPMYYVAVYIWLMIATPVLAVTLGRKQGRNRFIRFVTGLILVVIVSYYTTSYIDILGIILGGGKILAGPWLLFHYLGMSVALYEEEIVKNLCKPVFLGANTVILIAWQYVFVFKGYAGSVPAIFGYEDILISWATLPEVLLILIWFIQISVITGNKENTVLRLMAVPGKYSLYIFLYHILFLKIYVTHMLTMMLNISHLLNRITLIAYVFICPILLGYLMKGFHKDKSR